MTARKVQYVVDLGLPKKPEDIALRATVIVASMRASSWFPEPVPSLDEVDAAITVFQDAVVAALTRARGLTEDRNAKQGAMEVLLKLLAAYVQRIANENSSFALEIITAASMHVRGTRRRGKVPFRVTKGPLPGTAKLWAKAVAKRATYYWQMSADGGQTWIDLDKTIKADTIVTGLIPNWLYMFRFCAAKRDNVKSDWSQLVPYRTS